jgi:hypothetical protein
MSFFLLFIANRSGMCCEVVRYTILYIMRDIWFPADSIPFKIQLILLYSLASHPFTTLAGDGAWSNFVALRERLRQCWPENNSLASTILFGDVIAQPAMLQTFGAVSETCLRYLCPSVLRL